MIWKLLGLPTIRTARAAWAASALLLPIACAAKPDVEVLTIDSADYEQAFNTVLEVAREEGMPGAIRDRRAGLIETTPAVAPSLSEPWRSDGATLSRRAEHTISLQRRRARFEFTPVRFEPIAGAAEPLTGPDLLALNDPPADLSTYSGPLELRVWVFLERAHENGLRRDQWTRGKTTRTQIVSYDDDGRTVTEPSVFWTAETRDTDFEQRLLERVRRMLGTANPLDAG